MATLVLTTVGTAIGGPLGGALGAFVGRQIDQNILFKPKGREGPRIQELAVQTSSYGTQIARIFGRMRVAGSVIWATDLKETKNTEGGKGRPNVTTYSYSACFAVALSSRPIQKIGRIWADGKIFRGVGGDFKTPTGFRLWEGHEDQKHDNLIASAEGVNDAPAYRGIAMAVFEDMELADYGNRIPSLTFEVFGDDGSVSLVDIVDDISNQKVAVSSAEHLHGYAASGANRRSALEPLVENFLLSFWTEDDQIFGHSRAGLGSVVENIKSDQFLSENNRSEVAKPKFETAPESKIPRQLSLRYYEPARDYQSGLQNSFRPGMSRVVEKRDFPAAIDAAKAVQLSQNQIWNLYRERSTASVDVPNNSQLFRPGQLVRLDDEKTWAVRSHELRSGAVSLSMTSNDSLPGISEFFEGDAGRSVSDPDDVAGITRLILFDLPFAPDTPKQAATSPQLFAIAAGQKGWRNADLYRVQENGSVGDFVSKITSPGIMGEVEHVFQPSSGLLFDQQSEVTVKLQNSHMILNDADEAQLSAGQNIALIGQEIVQFARAKPLGNGRYSLSKFYRGLGGTERFIENHREQENFILFDRHSVTLLPVNHYTPFQSSRFAALGRDDPAPIEAEIASPGSALMPWQPAHLNYSFTLADDLDVMWVRLSRVGSLWTDHVDVPLAEELERYVVSWENESGELLGDIFTETASIRLQNTKVTDYRGRGISKIRIAVRQHGQHTLSPPSFLDIPL